MTTNLKMSYPMIPADATIVCSDTVDSLFPLTNIVAGSRRSYSQLSTSRLGQSFIEFQLGSSQAADHLIIAQANRLRRSGVRSLSLRAGAQPWNLPQTLTGIKLHMDATRGVTFDSSTNQVSAWADQSGNGKTASQSTSSKQPIYSRADNKENRVFYSEDLTNSHWTKTNTTISSNAIANPIDGALTADLVLETAVTNQHIVENYLAPGYSRIFKGESINFSVYVKDGGRGWCVFLRSTNSGTFSGSKYCWINLSTGAVGTAIGSMAPTVTSAGSGWWRISWTETAAGSGHGTMQIYTATADNVISFLGDVTKGVYVYGAQIRKASSDSTYLSNTSAMQIAGINGLRSLWFDGSDDWLNTDYYPDIAAGMTIFFVARGFFNGSAGGAVVMCNDDTSQSRFDTHWDSARNAYFYIVKDWSNYLLRYMLAETLDSTFIQSYRYDGGTSSSGLAFYKNGAQIDTTSAPGGSYTAPSVGTKSVEIGSNKSGANSFWPGEICEVIIYEAALSTSDRQAVEEYLTAKWVTAPIYQTHTLNTDTLYGPNDEDLLTTFNSTSFKYWQLTFDAPSVSSKRPICKVSLGAGFDIGRDPIYGREIALVDRGARTKRQAFRYTLDYLGLTNAKQQAFETAIGRKLENPIFFYSTSHHPILLDDRVLHAKIIDYEFTPRTYSKQNLNITIEELVT